jgi:hypothetical protein
MRPIKVIGVLEKNDHQVAGGERAATGRSSCCNALRRRWFQQALATAPAPASTPIRGETHYKKRRIMSVFDRFDGCAE